MDDKQVDERMTRWDAFWNGPRFIMLLGGFLAFALAVIYTIASVRSGDFTWNPIANQPERDLPISNW